MDEVIGCNLCHESCSECSGQGSSKCTLCSNPYSWLTTDGVCVSCSKSYDPADPNCQFITELKLVELKKEKDINSSVTLQLEIANVVRFKELIADIKSENIPEYLEVS